MSHTDSAHGYGGSRDNPEVAHEHDDVNVRALAGFVVGMFAVIAVVFGLMYGVFRVFEREAAKNDPALSPLARGTTAMPATTMHEPFFGQAEGARLMTNEPSVLQKQRAMEADVLNTYGWVDEKAGVARLPIEEAKKLILTRGLPARAEAPADPALGTRRGAYTDSSGGRPVRPAQATEPAQAPPAAPHKTHGQ